ncbi:MAG TPA: glycoside hydrolase family 3 N-terminal domain-containing protein [Prolixibacteraceae bacterium]|nr:glycoside hydrolase family 3 N-terminal domain-containing protein [Prolixibacteraceae bacterium]
MKKQKITFLTTRFLLIVLVCSTVSCSTGPAKKSVKEIVSAMTLEQKAQLVIGTGMHFELPDSIMAKMPSGFGGKVEETDTTYSNMVDKIRKCLPGAAGFSAEFPALGITSQVLSDGPAGLRIQPKRKGEEKTYYCTAFPIATVLASTWDTDLIYRVGQAMGNEVKEYGSDILLAPALNIQRDPLCGRNFEYYSEDPLVAGKMAAAMVNGIQSNGVGTSIKHFAANNSETNRMSVNTIVSERALREIYLKGFEITVKEAQPWTVMSSYNKINGVYTSESHDLLTNILRNDWGFKGYVMTDWGGGSDVVAQMNAGNDMIQPGQPKQINELIAAVKEGKLDEKVLDLNITRILEIMLKSPRYNNYPFSGNPDLAAHAAVTRQAASDGMVLLKNSENALPIQSSVKTVAAFGNTSYDFIAGGTGSGDVNEAYTISLTDGLKNGGYTISEELQEIYSSYVAEIAAKKLPSKNPFAAFLGGKDPVAEMAVSPALAQKLADKNDIGLITLGRNAGEGYDRTATEGDFYLSSTEKEMIKNVTAAFHAKGKKVVVILNVAGVIEIASWRDIPDAILLAWQPGQEGGNSVVDVLSGKVNPSGKLAVTFPMNYTDAPTAKNFPGVAEKSEVVDTAADLSGFSFMRRTPWEVIYEEDIYVGYRYYNTFNVPVAYEFGYGLSYTSFNFSNLKLSSDDFSDQITVSVDVKNTGEVAGREVAQVYLGAPAQKLNKPEEELVAFAKTKMLNPGESQTLSFTLKAQDLASFDEKISSWIAEAGKYEVKIGNSSKNITQTGSFSLKQELVTGKVSKALAPEREINKLVH